MLLLERLSRWAARGFYAGFCRVGRHVGGAAPLGLAVALLVGFSSPAVEAAAEREWQPAMLAVSLPKYFVGCFFWAGENKGQEVRYVFQSVRQVRDGRVIATGEGLTSTTKSAFHIQVRISINPNTMALDIRESDPHKVVGRGNYVTDGSFSGQLSGDLSQINAIWRASKSEESGELNLVATSHFAANFGGERVGRCEGSSS